MTVGRVASPERFIRSAADVDEVTRGPRPGFLATGVPGWEDDGVDQLYEVRPVEWSGLYYSSFEDESLAFAVLAGVLGVGDDRR